MNQRNTNNPCSRVGVATWLYHYRFLLAVTMLAACLFTGFLRPVPARAASISTKKLTLLPSQTVRLKVKGATGSVRWTTSDEDVAEVSRKGKVTAVGVGYCRITARCNGKRYKCKVWVIEPTLSKTSLQMIRGRQATLVLKNGDEPAAGVEWSSSAPAVASVDQSGTVHALLTGSAVITATWNGLRYDCSVNVTEISVEALSQTYPASENQGKIVLAGSSSMDFWENAPQAFAPYEVLNTAIGGSTVTQWLSWYPLLITNYKPSAVVIYVGSNDIANGNGVSASANAANTIQLLTKITNALPGTPVFYVSINPCWARKGAWEAVKVSNAKVKEFCDKQNNLYYIDIVTPSASADGTPNKDLFLADQLHPSAQGYQVWKTAIVSRVTSSLKPKA